jgi:hypothetical protein
MTQGMQLRQGGYCASKTSVSGMLAPAVEIAEHLLSPATSERPAAAEQGHIEIEADLTRESEDEQQPDILAAALL